MIRPAVLALLAALADSSAGCARSTCDDCPPSLGFEDILTGGLCRPGCYDGDGHRVGSPPDPAPQAVPAPASCEIATGDPGCIACMKRACCQKSRACLADDGCVCAVSCRSGQGPTCSCAAGATSDAVLACISDHCARECPWAA